MPELTPLSELEGNVTDRIAWGLELESYAQPDQIGINLPFMDRLVRLAGYDSVHVTSFAGRKDQVNPSVSGRNEDGSAIMSGAATKSKAPRQHIEASGPIRSGDFWPAAPGNQQALIEIISPSYKAGELKINSSKLTSEVEKRGNLRNSKAWADALNLALTAALREGAQKNLISKQGGAMLAATLGYAGMQSQNFIHLESLYASSILANISLVALATYGVGSVAMRFKSPGDTRWALIPGIQLDRLGTIYAATAIRRLVRQM